MKDKEKKIEQVAKQIVELEIKCKLDNQNQNEYINEMQQLTENLSLEELLEIDEYILENNLLKS